MSNNKKLKITQVTKFAYPNNGGIEAFVEMLNRCLGTDDFDISVLSCSNTQKSSVENSIKYTRCPYLFEFAANTISPKFIWELSKVNTDILVYNMPFIFSVIAHFIARPKYKKMVIAYHSDIIGYDKVMKPFEKIYNKFLDMTDVIHVQSPQLKDNSKILQKFKNKCVVIPHPVSINFNYDAIAVKNLKSKYKNKKIIFSLGRLVGYKGFKHAIEAMTNVEGAVLLIGGLGPLYKELNDYIKENNLTSKVFLLGKIKSDELENYYEVCDIYLFPSVKKSEAYGLVQLEAMKHSRPIINTNLGTGVNYVSVHNETGLTVEPKNPKQLANAINLLLNDDELRLKLGQNARKRVEDLFDIEKIKYQYKEFFRSINV